MSLALIEQLQSELDSLKAEYEKFELKGNSVAGTRARKILQNIKNLSQQIRADIQEKKKAKES